MTVLSDNATSIREIDVIKKNRKNTMKEAIKFRIKSDKVIKKKDQRPFSIFYTFWNIFFVKIRRVFLLFFLYFFFVSFLMRKYVFFLQLSIEWHRISIQILHAVHKNSCYINTKCRLWLKAWSETKIEYEANTFSLWKKKQKGCHFYIQFSHFLLKKIKSKTKHFSRYSGHPATEFGIWKCSHNFYTSSIVFFFLISGKIDE